MLLEGLGGDVGGLGLNPIFLMQGSRRHCESGIHGQFSNSDTKWEPQNAPFHPNLSLGSLRDPSLGKPERGFMPKLLRVYKRKIWERNRDRT